MNVFFMKACMVFYGLFVLNICVCHLGKNIGAVSRCVSRLWNLEYLFILAWLLFQAGEPNVFNVETAGY